MKYFCTLSDWNYLPKGLVLYESLLTTSKEEFVLYYLCLDEKSFTTLRKANYQNIIPIDLFDLETKKLQTAKANRPYNQYCWTLASYFCQYLLKTYGMTGITYIDSDILFYQDIDSLYKEIGEKSVGLIAHRHNKVGDTDGAFNVSVIYFKNDKIGCDALFWWSDAVLNQRYPKFQTCGDQKYLEAFIPLFGEENICIADNTFGHAAPWNYRLYDWSRFQEGKIIWNGKEQSLLFTHFSRMSYDLQKCSIDYTSGFYKDHTLGGSVFNSIPQLPIMYMDYLTKLRQAHDLLAGSKLRIAFGMIVLNGAYVLKQCLESIYPYASQIMIAEGPVEFWQKQGLTTSTDKTNEIIDSFPDPEKKISVVHGQYAEKDEQCQAYMKFMKPDTDYLWQVDSDEIYKAKDIETIISLLETKKYTSVGVRSCSFYGSFDRYMTGFEEQCDQYLRIFKVYPGSFWKTHRPPTMAHTQTTVLPDKHLDSDTLFSRYEIRMYHYSAVFPNQVRNKMKYYQSLAQGKFIENYFSEVYYPWVVGSNSKKMEIENKYVGVHEYRPEFRGSSFTQIFKEEHPEPIKRDMSLLVKEWENQFEGRMLMNSWKNRDVFERQIVLNLEELKNLHSFVPFHYGDFLHFIESIKSTAVTLLDVGCGCGVYSELCRCFAPWIKYQGIDYAQEAINVARTQWPGEFNCRDYKDLRAEDFKHIDILHACSLHNVLPNGKECMDFLLSLGAKFVILGKILLTDKQSYYDVYKAYDTIYTYMFYHNYEELQKSFRDNGYEAEEIRHDNTCNILLRKK